MAEPAHVQWLRRRGWSKVHRVRHVDEALNLVWMRCGAKHRGRYFGDDFRLRWEVAANDENCRQCFR